MSVRKRKPNNKRKICSQEALPDGVSLEALAGAVVYCGNPAHKKNPGDFGLTPPAGARSSKSLCDVAQIFEKAVAQRLLQEGARRGLVSTQFRGGWPQSIWAVTEQGVVLEAQLENQVTGAYHGYPLPPSDPLTELVMQQWNGAQP